MTGAIDENRIYLLLGELRGDVKAILASRSETKADVEDLDKRVAVLEKSRHIMLGGAAAIGAVVTPAIQYIIKHM